MEFAAREKPLAPPEAPSLGYACCAVLVLAAEKSRRSSLVGAAPASSRAATWPCWDDEGVEGWREEEEEETWAAARATARGTCIEADEVECGGEDDELRPVSPPAACAEEEDGEEEEWCASLDKPYVPKAAPPFFECGSRLSRSLRLRRGSLRRRTGAAKPSEGVRALVERFFTPPP